MRRAVLGLLALGLLGGAAASAYLYEKTGLYGFNVILRRGGSLWTDMSPDDPRVTESMRLALRPNPPRASGGPVSWTMPAPGFEVAEMPVMAEGREVDRILLTRIDPRRYHFEVHNRPAGDMEPADWLGRLGAEFVINGSYFDVKGLPSVPTVSNGSFLGPVGYSASHGAFVATADGAEVRDLAGRTWQDAFKDAENAMVSYPLLRSRDGANRVRADDRWLANRSFVGQDDQGRLVFGTTKDAFFSLRRLAEFLKDTPLGLSTVLNLDGGPLACQGIALPGARRDFCGEWETSVRDGQLSLLRPMVGSRRWALAVVIVAFPRMDAAKGP